MLKWNVSLSTVGLSLVLFGWWPANLLNATSVSWNASLWPYTLPVGLALLVAALRQRQRLYALAAGPCFAPYLAFHSWVAALAALAPRTGELVAAVIGLWLMLALQAG